MGPQLKIMRLDNLGDNDLDPDITEIKIPLRIALVTIGLSGPSPVASLWEVSPDSFSASLINLSPEAQPSAEETNPCNPCD